MAIMVPLRRPRRTFAIAVAITTLVATTVVVRAAQDAAKATSGGDPYAVPLAVDVNPDPNIFETTLTAQAATVDIGNGVMAHALTFNGTIPGPELRLKVNDTVIVHFKNQLPGGERSGIHWHGIELNNHSDGTPVTQGAVASGGEYLYKFKVPRPGIFWYHPHHHDSTNQVFKGMFGSVIVTDPNDATLQNNGKLPPQSATRSLILSDTTVCKGGTEDTNTYNPGSPAFPAQPPPWVGGAFTAQPGPQPNNLCTTPIDANGAPTGVPLTAGDIPNIQPAAGAGTPPVVEGQTVLTNGKNVGVRAGSPSAPGALGGGAATLPVVAGQGVRFQVVNAATTRYMRLRLTSSTGTLIKLFRVGGEGGLLDSAILEGGTPGGYPTKYDEGEILLPPGDRADIVAAIPPGSTGVATLWTEDFQRVGVGGGGGSNGFSVIPTVPIAHLAISGNQPIPYTISTSTLLRASIPGQAVEVLPAATATLIPGPGFVPAKPGKAAPLLPITFTAAGTPGIDGISTVHDDSVAYTDPVNVAANARYARLFDVLDLQVTNSTGAHHPFHLHGFSIQPVSLTKPASPTFTWGALHEFRDQQDIPAGYTLNFKVRLDDRPMQDGVTPGGGLGRWLMHCHIFFHHGLGMISELIVLPPGLPATNGNEKPNIDADAVATTVAFGGLATMTGTVSDPDGDAVTLTASVGTVVNNNNGTWSWSHAPAAVPQFVYITATDPGGRKVQAVFEVKVTCATNISGNVPTSVAANSGTWCITNATITGSVTVGAGTSVVVSSSTIGGNFTGSNTGAVLLCGTTVTGQTQFSGANGFVLLGDPGDDGCAGNSLRNVTLTSNKSGVEVSKNTINGSLNVNGTTGAGPFPQNVAPNIEGNLISASLNCSGNSPAPVNNASPNTALSKSGQCVAL